MFFLINYIPIFVQFISCSLCGIQILNHKITEKKMRARPCLCQQRQIGFYLGLRFPGRYFLYCYVTFIYTYLINIFPVQTHASTMLLKMFPLFGDLSWRAPDQPPSELLISKFTLSRSIYCVTCYMPSTWPRMKTRQSLAS